MAKRLTIVVLAGLLLSMLFVGVAFADFGPHGGYVQDTDACAACHRAHTSFATATFADAQGAQRYGLLVSGASTITEFCLACHGSNTPGASTNVVNGIFDGGPSAPVDGSANTTYAASGVYTPYETDSTYLAALNGGAFAGSTSTHQMQSSNLPMWGSYSGSGDSPKSWGLFTCIDCHDPHGSSNYRILRDTVNVTAVVGGYDASGTPSPFVVSNESGYPMGGWDKGVTGQLEMAAYKPSYTTPKYANSGASTGISLWCAGCHTQYATRNDNFSTTGHSAVNNGLYEAYPYNSATATNSVGDMARHRHPVNTVTLAGATGLYVTPTLSAGLPLEMSKGTNESAPLSTDVSGTPIYWNANGYVGCLTCHYAHGTNVTMDGWANAALQPGNLGMVPVQLPAGATMSNVPSSTKTWTGGTGATQIAQGVNPGFSSALLRYPNRGVCERCHNK